MAREILGEYGPDAAKRDAGRATSGGVTSAKDLRYATPQGPKGQMHSGPGLGGSNSGTTQRPTGKSSSGGPGLGGTNHGCCGSQGRH